ncbi:MAG: GTPase ObgE [Candidatus Marinimicrobia bacterium]|nr:GTPase ObgE [Candidatus Neomarinimicrobiota bacterium]|tara:strand:+ start:16272 stop:17243 length:972 start_codon:yes stop_codon:yes gene_type:complete
MKFIDYAKISVSSGKGGDGCVAFLREKFRPKGGPSGGDGGKGGSIVFQSDSKLTTLQDYSYNKQYFAKSGENGKGKNMHGKNAQNIVLKVPVGTIVRDVDQNKIIYDFNNDNEEIIVCKGGNGGFGNARFKTNKNPAPRFANDGEKGILLNLELELKVLADVGLVGFPNAGKSTFISSISNARPKIADYPFTTLIPNLGIVNYGQYKSFVMADIPGLIEGASNGKGLGTQFLKHIERTKILVFIIDLNSEDVENEYNLLCNELKSFDERLLDKPKIILLSKLDLVSNDDIDLLFFKNMKDVIKISSVSKQNIDKAINLIANHL